MRRFYSYLAVHKRNIFSVSILFCAAQSSFGSPQYL
jgi:hypothetical protein